MQVNLEIFNNLQNKRQIKHNDVYRAQSPASYGAGRFALSTDTISFGANDVCAPKNFQVKNLPELYCPACGAIMLRDEEINRYASTLSTKKGAKLVDMLNRFENMQDFGIGVSGKGLTASIYRPYIKPVVEAYKNLAMKYPSKDLYELTKLHAAECIGKLREEQLVIVEELKQFVADNIPSEEQRSIFSIINDYENRITGQAKESFYRKDFIDTIVGLFNEEHKDRVKQIVLKMPNSQNDVNSFFVKHAKKANNAKDIAIKLIDDSLATVEHIVPVNAKGKNELSNYICDCKHCNNSRRSTPFDVWMKELPEGFEGRLQEYLQVVQDNIDKGKLDAKYDNYIRDIIETIEKVSNGKIRLALPETKNHVKKRRIFAQRQEQIESSKAQNCQLEKTVLMLAQEIARLEAYNQLLNPQEDEAAEYCNNIQNRKKEVFVKIQEFAPVAKQIEELLQRKLDKEKSEQAVEKYSATIAALKVDIEKLEEENIQISPSGDFSKEELETWERYLYCIKVLSLLQKVMQTQDYRRLKLPTSDAKEIFNYTDEALGLEIETLKSLPVVKYKLNSESIERLKERIRANQGKLGAEQDVINSINQLEAGILSECQGKTIEEFSREYQMLKTELEIIDELQNIKSKKSKLEAIRSKIRKNNRILEQLEKSANDMSNLEYNNLFKQLSFEY